MAAIFGGTEFFGKLGQLLSKFTLWVKKFVEIALSSMVFKIQTFCALHFWKKIENSKWPPFWWVKNSLNLGKASLHRPPMDQKVLAKSLYVALFSRCVLWFLRKIRKFKMAGQKNFENWVTYSRVTLWVKHFIKITLSSTVFEIQAFFCFAFLKKIRKFKMATILLKLGRLVFTDTLWVKSFAEIALSRMVFEKEAFFCFAKNLKIQNGRHSWWDKIFLKTGSATQQKNPVDQRFRRICSI